MTKRRVFPSFLLMFVGASVFVALFVLAVSKERPDPFSFAHTWLWRTVAPERGENIAQVKRAVDGDTILLENGEKVRYIGVNTPESVDPRQPVECFGKEASAFNRDLVEGKRVRLERDTSDRDKYGRLLRFVYLEDGTLVNEILVREGYAFVATYPPDIAKQEIFRSAEKLARDEKRGLWNEMTCNGKK